MVINENNSQMNSFVKGMNSDTSFDQVPNEQYILGQNIRITKNQILSSTGVYSTVHEGIVTPVPSGQGAGGWQIEIGRILSVQSIEDLAIIVTTKPDSGDEGDGIYVYKFIMDEVNNTPKTQIKLVWKCDNIWPDGAPDKISTVLYQELENVTKLYIATGRHPIISLRVDDQSEDKYYDSVADEYTPVDKLINNREVPTKRIYIKDIISGRLITSQVQYTYRCYNKYGNTTQLAPLTNKIQVIDPSRTKETGNAENTETSIGFTLNIDITDYKKPNYERIQVFRLSYITPGQDAEVALIYDGEIKEVVTNTFELNDVGLDPLQKYSMEEFAAMSGLILIPQVIEQNQEYMFCSNVKDDTIIRDVEVAGWADPIGPDQTLSPLQYMVDANVILAELGTGDIPDPGVHYYKDGYDDLLAGYTVNDYLEERGINHELAKATYNDIITSSLLRSLRRGETYRYGIIFYDNKGRRTDVINIGSITIPEYSNNRPFTVLGDRLIAKPVGVNLPMPTLRGESAKDIIGCQIIRRSSSEVYQKNLLQVAMARPVSQVILDTKKDSNNAIDEEIDKKSPFYPTGYLCVNDFTIKPTYYHSDAVDHNNDKLFAKTRSNRLFQIFSSEIDFRRNDVLSKINISDTTITEVLYLYPYYAKYRNSTKDTIYSNNFPDGITISSSGIVFDRFDLGRMSTDTKQSQQWVFNYYYRNIINQEYTPSGFGTQQVNNVKDVKIPEWSSGFTEIQRQDDQNIYTAIKKYKSYSTNIDSFSYNNWVSSCKYDFRAGQEDQPNVQWGETNVSVELLGTTDLYKMYVNGDKDTDSCNSRNGYIGPGPSCFLLTTKEETSGFPTYRNKFYTSICNIAHTPKQVNVESDEFVRYYGFGNYFNLIARYDPNTDLCTFVTNTQNNKSYLTVFDGDIYITPHEFTTLYKAYDFNSFDTLQSTQITNYIPLESKVNTYFDYGMNLMNTQSENLMYEPGHIDGIATQDRPVHQYNMIYSDNDASNDVFTLISTDKDETNQFRQRTYYSDLKTNGEFIDNFLIFKAAQFIDVDSRYGEVTNLLTDRNNLFYWQTNAFGKFSVNERSLVNDQNNNTIMLGQAGILSRYDYLSTKYGMRLHDFCARSIDAGIFWVDINNKAIAAYTGNNVVNYGEQLNVQNIINNKISNDVPYVDYDLQNDELLCKCFTNGDQIVFNVKYNLATAIYTRNYEDMLYIKNHLFGLRSYIENNEYFLNITKHNYLSGLNQTDVYLSPALLSFVVNPMASITKVFDSQQLIPIKREAFNPQSGVDNAVILNSTTFSFETDIMSKAAGSGMEPHTDREGNIIYNIPRYVQGDGYGNRMRGKWMLVNIETTDPAELFTISHVITKFRQSYS